MRNTCFLAGVPELFTCFRNSLVGKTSRGDSVDDTAVHWRIQCFLVGYNQMAQRYLPKYGTALRVARVSDDHVDAEFALADTRTVDESVVMVRSGSTDTIAYNCDFGLLASTELPFGFAQPSYVPMCLRTICESSAHACSSPIVAHCGHVVDGGCEGYSRDGVPAAVSAARLQCGRVECVRPLRRIGEAAATALLSWQAECARAVVTRARRRVARWAREAVVVGAHAGAFLQTLG